MLERPRQVQEAGKLMDALTPLAAYDLIRFAELYLSRLEQALGKLESAAHCERERTWLAGVTEALRDATKAGPDALEKARSLPELAEVRGDFAAVLQGQWVDALERLHAGIMFHAGARSPVLEGLFPHARFGVLRKASAEAAEAWAADFERRLKSGYLTRMFAQEEFAFVPPVVVALQQAHSRWQECLKAPTEDSELARPAREALLFLGATLELRLAQARAVAHAALLPLEGSFDSLGLQAKPKRRPPALPKTSSLPPMEGPEAQEGNLGDSAPRAAH